MLSALSVFAAAAALQPPVSRLAVRTASLRTTRIIMGRKPGVSSPEDLAAFVKAAGDNLIVIDTRNTDFSVEPGDGKVSSSLALIQSDC